MRALLLSLTVILTGCAVTADGIGPAHRSLDYDKISQMRTQLQTNEASAGANAMSAKSTDAESLEPGFVLIGTTGPYRPLDEGGLKKFYAVYSKAAEKWHPEKPAKMDEATFTSTFTGYASIETASIPGVMNWRRMALVPKNVAEQATFASKAGSFLFGTTGDLVSAKSSEGIVVLDRVLCRDDETYRDCARAFKRGAYDGVTGEELGEGLKPKKGGARIDPQTCRRIAD